MPDSRRGTNKTNSRDRLPTFPGMQSVIRHEDGAWNGADCIAVAGKKRRAGVPGAAYWGTELAFVEAAPQFLLPRRGFKTASSRKQGAGLLKLQLQKPVFFARKPAPVACARSPEPAFSVSGYAAVKTSSHDSVSSGIIVRSIHYSRSGRDPYLIRVRTLLLRALAWDRNEVAELVSICEEVNFITSSEKSRSRI